MGVGVEADDLGREARYDRSCLGGKFTLLTPM